MTEDELKAAVYDLCRLRHLIVAHFRPALTAKGRWVTPVEADAKGYPDCTIVGPGGVLFRELKNASRSLEPEQRVWVARLSEAGADVDVWRPRHLADGTIAATLTKLARPRRAVVA